MKANEIFGARKASYLILDDFEIKAEWYDDPVDQMLVYMGNDPRPEAPYTVPKHILVQDAMGVWITWSQRYKR